MDLVRSFSYCGDDDCDVTEIVDLNSIEWKPCSKRARKFVPLNAKPATIKASWKPSPKFIDSTEHSVKGYADDMTLISNDLDSYPCIGSSDGGPDGQCSGFII